MNFQVESVYRTETGFRAKVSFHTPHERMVYGYGEGKTRDEAIRLATLRANKTPKRNLKLIMGAKR